MSIEVLISPSLRVTSLERSLQIHTIMSCEKEHTGPFTLQSLTIGRIKNNSYHHVVYPVIQREQSQNTSSANIQALDG